MNYKKLVKSPVFWAVVAIISSACGCGENVTTQSAKIISAPEKQEKQEKQQEKSQAKADCPMEWTSPTSSSNAGDMPPTGMVSFDWTDHPEASGYEMTLVTPNSSPVFYDTDGSAKDLFLENYSQVGSYQLVVTALDSNGLPLCSITMDFNMPVVSTIDKPKNNNNDEEVEQPSSGFFPWFPVIILQPTDEVPR
ncbi:MAG: hypothetical protein ACKOBL_22810 [Chloroflexota bacterium]